MSSECQQDYFASDEYRIKERISARLHERAGLCGHCGKHSCAGRHSNSYLPELLELDDVVVCAPARHTGVCLMGAVE